MSAYPVRTRKTIVTGIRTKRAPARRRLPPIRRMALRNAVMPAKQKKFGSSATALNTAAAIADGNTHLIKHITDISSGNEFDDREMPVIQVKGIKMKCILSSADTKSKGARLVILSPKSAVEGDLTTGTLAKLFLNVTYQDGDYDKLSGSLIYPINRERFKVVYDKVININPKIGENGYVYLNKYVKLKKPIEVGFDKDVTTGTATYNKLYALVLLAEWDNVTNANGVNANCVWTTYFRDGHNVFAKGADQ